MGRRHGTGTAGRMGAGNPLRAGAECALRHQVRRRLRRPGPRSGRLAQFEPPTAIQLGSIRLELQAVDDGCQITFSDVLWFDDKRAKTDFANAVLAGWHRFLDTLEIWLDERRPALDIQEPDYAKVHVDGRDAL